MRKRNQPVANANANVREEGSGIGVGRVSTPDVQEMFHQCMMNMMRNALGAAAVGGDTDIIRVGGVVQPPRMVFAKLMRDFVNMGGQNFNGTKSDMEVHKWLESCEEMFRDLKLEDALKRRLTLHQLIGRARSQRNAIAIVTPKEVIT